SRSASPCSAPPAAHTTGVVMKIVVAGVSTLLALPVAACLSGRAGPSPAVVKLVDLYKPEALHGGGGAAAKARKKTEWRFDGADPKPAPKEFAKTRGWEAGLGVSGFAIKDGQLTGKTTSAYPLIQIERTDDLDNRDQFFAVEIRMKVSAGGTV